MNAEETKPASNRRRNILIVVVAAILLLAVSVPFTFQSGIITPLCSGFDCGANVSVTSATCVAGTTSTCTVSFENVGASATATVQCSLQANNSTTMGVNGGEASVNIPPNGSATGTCSVSADAKAGSGVQGQFTLEDGQAVYFAATWA